MRIWPLAHTNSVLHMAGTRSGPRRSSYQRAANKFHYRALAPPSSDLDSCLSCELLSTRARSWLCDLDALLERTGCSLSLLFSWVAFLLSPCLHTVRRFTADCGSQANCNFDTANVPVLQTGYESACYRVRLEGAAMPLCVVPVCAYFPGNEPTCARVWVPWFWFALLHF